MVGIFLVGAVAVPEPVAADVAVIAAVESDAVAEAVAAVDFASVSFCGP